MNESFVDIMGGRVSLRFDLPHTYLSYIYLRYSCKLSVTLTVQKKVTMDYGFPSLDEELAKDHLDGENA